MAFPRVEYQLQTAAAPKPQENLCLALEDAMDAYMQATVQSAFSLLKLKPCTTIARSN